MKKFSEQEKQDFIHICQSSRSMSEACATLGLHFNTFKRYAIKFNCYYPNQGLKGVSKPNTSKMKTKDILDGKYPHYQTYKLKKRLIDEGYLIDECAICGWNGKLPNAEYSNCELHHKDGDRFNHSLSNLELLCPNCHSLTATYRARNKI